MSDKIKMLRGKMALATKAPLRVSMSGYSIKSYDPDVPIVAAVHGGATASPRQLEAWINNADMLVEAANHLDALVGVAEAAEELRYQAVASCPPADSPMQDAINDLRAALAKLAAVE